MFGTAILLLAFQARIVNLPNATPEQKRQAEEFMKTVFNPILSKHSTDPQELPAIKDRIWKLSRLSTSHTLEYETVAVKSPFHNHTDVAKIDYNKDNGKPRLMVFVPQVKEDKLDYDWSGRPQDFEDYVVLTISHEIIHLELIQKNPAYDKANRTGWPDRALQMQNEAEAWGITILEIARPMLAKKRHVPKTMADASELLKKFGDNYHDPRWISGFYDMVMMK